MKQSILIEELKNYVGRTAHHKNPQITANAIYFSSKQNSLLINKNRTYIKILKQMKTFLSNDFNWSMVEIHSCFCILHKLVIYSKKNT